MTFSLRVVLSLWGEAEANYNQKAQNQAGAHTDAIIL